MFHLHAGTHLESMQEVRARVSRSASSSAYEPWSIFPSHVISYQQLGEVKARLSRCFYILSHSFYSLCLPERQVTPRLPTIKLAGKMIRIDEAQGGLLSVALQPSSHVPGAFSTSMFLPMLMQRSKTPYKKSNG